MKKGLSQLIVGILILIAISGLVTSYYTLSRKESIINVTTSTTTTSFTTSTSIMTTTTSITTTSIPTPLTTVSIPTTTITNITQNCPSFSICSECVAAGCKFCRNINNMSDTVCIGEEQTIIAIYTCKTTCLECKEVITGFNNEEENRINIVFMGINFPDIDSLKNSLDIYVNSDDEVYGQLFYYEPFKSNKDKFNLWYVNEIGFVEEYNEGTTYWGSEANPEIDRLSKYCNVQNKQEVALINWLFKDNAWFGKRVKISHVASEGKSGAVFVHEFGHSFGLLGDEDASRTVSLTTPDFENCDIVTDEIACLKWCSGPPVSVEEMENFVCTGSTQSSCMQVGIPCLWIPYDDPIYGQTGCVNRVKFCKNIVDKPQCNNAKNSFWRSSACIWLNNEDYPAYSYFKSNCIPTSSGDFNIGRNCLEDTGCYQTCGHSNWFKSSQRSMMRSAGFPFGTINERALCRRIQNITGSVGGICTTKFGLS